MPCRTYYFVWSDSTSPAPAQINQVPALDIDTKEGRFFLCSILATPPSRPSSFTPRSLAPRVPWELNPPHPPTDRVAGRNFLE